MTLGQYRALVAYLNYWTPQYPEMELTTAMSDIGITDVQQDVIDALFKAGHTWDEETKRLIWED